MGSWIAGAVAVDGGVVIPGIPTHHAADLRLDATGLAVSTAEHSIELSWDDWARLRPGMDVFGDLPEPGNHWGFVPFILDRGQAGVALKGTGSIEAALAPLKAEFDTTRNRVSRRMAMLTARSAVPLWADATGLLLRSLRGLPDLTTISVLAQVLNAEPALRDRVAAEPSRLASGLSRPMGWPVQHDGGRRETVETITALRTLGYRHTYGRPMPGDHLAPVDEVVDAVLGAIARNPYSEGFHPSRTGVETIVRRDYLDIEPWPFEALTG